MSDSRYHPVPSPERSVSSQFTFAPMMVTAEAPAPSPPVDMDQSSVLPVPIDTPVAFGVSVADAVVGSDPVEGDMADGANIPIDVRSMGGTKLSSMKRSWTSQERSAMS